MFGPVNIALSDYLELTKPRITSLVVFTTGSGLWLAPVQPRMGTVLLTLIGTAVVVAAANVLNMYLERETDALMPRTMHRPLPAGRMNPSLALGFGLLLAAVTVPLLFLGVGPLPGLLALIALVSYVLIYTPMKRYTAAALWSARWREPFRLSSAGPRRPVASTCPAFCSSQSCFCGRCLTFSPSAWFGARNLLGPGCRCSRMSQMASAGRGATSFGTPRYWWRCLFCSFPSASQAPSISLPRLFRERCSSATASTACAQRRTSDGPGTSSSPRSGTSPYCSPCSWSTTPTSSDVNVTKCCLGRPAIGISR